MDAEFCQNVVDLFNRFVNDLDGRLHYSMQNKGHVILQAPSFFIDILYISFRSTYNFGHDFDYTLGHLIFHGIEVQPTYELSLIIFHKDYPLYKEDWMLKKISFEPPRLVKTEWHTETVFKIMEYFGKFGKNPLDN